MHRGRGRGGRRGGARVGCPQHKAVACTICGGRAAGIERRPGQSLKSGQHANQIRLEHVPLGATDAVLSIKRPCGVGARVLEDAPLAACRRAERAGRGVGGGAMVGREAQQAAAASSGSSSQKQPGSRSQHVQQAAAGRPAGEGALTGVQRHPFCHVEHLPTDDQPCAVLAVVLGDLRHCVRGGAAAAGRRAERRSSGADGGDRWRHAAQQQVASHACML